MTRQQRLRKLMEEGDVVVAIFDQVWEVMSDEGMCDEQGGAEYDRVLSHWLATGLVGSLAGFIDFQGQQLLSPLKPTALGRMAWLLEKLGVTSTE